MFRYLLALSVGFYAMIPVVCGDEGNPLPVMVYKLRGDFDEINDTPTFYSLFESIMLH